MISNLTTVRRPTVVARLVAGATLVAAGLAVGTPAAAASDEACTVFGEVPGKMIAKVAPFDGQINPGNPVGLDDPVIPTLCRR